MRHMTHSLFWLCLACGAPALAQEAPLPQADRTVPKDVSLYTDASLRMHQQRHAEALRLLDQLLTEHPQSSMAAGAQFWKAQCLEELNRRGEARQAYQALIAKHAKSGWASDARRRLGALTAPTAGPVLAPTGPIKPGKAAQIVLTNGDRLSGQLVERGEKGYELSIPGVHTPLRLPRDRVLSVQAGITIDLSSNVSGATLAALPGSRRHAIVALLGGDEEDVEIERGGDVVKTTTRTNPDGSKTVTKVYKDGTRVETTIKKQGKDRRVTVVRELKGDDKQKVELKFALDDEEEMEKTIERHLKALEGLPQKLQFKLKDRLKGLEELDFDLELDDLKDLEKDLEGLPEKIRERIKRSLKSPRRKVRKVYRWRSKSGDQEEEFRFAPKNDHNPFSPKVRKRVVIKGVPGGNHTGGVWVGNDHDETVHVFANATGSTKDRVFLRNGDKISGKLLSVDGERVRMKTSYGEVTIKRDQVRQISFARTPKPFLGVSMASAKSGVKLSQVFPNTPAAKAGLKTGDVVTSANGAPIESAQDLGKAIKSKKVGDTLRLGVRRGEQSLTIEVKLGTKQPGTWAFDGDHGYRFMRRFPRAPRAPRPPSPPRLHKKMMLRKHNKTLHEHERKLHEHERRGALEHGRKAREQARKARDKARKAREQARQARDKARKALEKRERSRTRPGRPFLGVGLETTDDGVKITGVRDNSTASAIGLKAGDVITHWNGKRVRTTDDLIKALRQSKVGDKATLRATRGKGNVLELQFRLKARAKSSKRTSLAPVPPSAPSPVTAPAPPSPPEAGRARDF